MEKIIRRIIADASVYTNGIHGISHWHRVARYGRVIAAREHLDEQFLSLFAYFHDCQRLSDGRDPKHGPRAADYLLTYTPEAIGLCEEDQKRLALACRHHTYEIETDDATIRACWDCDRLDLVRIGVMVDPGRLFTETAKDIAQRKLFLKVEE